MWVVLILSGPTIQRVIQYRSSGVHNERAHSLLQSSFRLSINFSLSLSLPPTPPSLSPPPLPLLAWYYAIESNPGLRRRVFWPW